MENKMNMKQQNDQNILNRFLNSKTVKDERPIQPNINSSSISIRSDMNMNEKDINRQFINNNFSASLRSTLKKPEPDPIVSEITVQVRLRSNDKEDWVRDIKVTLIATFTSSNKMTINLNLTDESDPLFLYSVDIGETEFHSLKTEQSLLIDFQQFPQNLFEMLEKCNTIIRNEDYNNNINYNNFTQKNLIGNLSSLSSFVAILQFVNINEALLVIQENNTFRSLSHLTIRLRQATDHHLKNYLSSIVKEIKEKNENLLKENMKIKEVLDATNISFRKKEEELKKFQDNQYIGYKDSLLEIQATRNECLSEMNNIREKLVLEYQALLDNKDKEKNSEIKDLQEKLNKLKGEKEKLVEDYRVLDDTRKNLDTNLKETSSQFELAKRDLAGYKEELMNLRSQNKNLDQTKFSQEKNITEYTIKLDLLTKQLEEKENNLKNLKLMVESMQTQKNENDELIKSFKTTNSKLEEKLGHSVSEINKGNEIIKKLQNDVKAQKKLTKSKVQVITQNEQLLSQKQLQIEDCSKIVNEIKKDNEKKEEEIKSVKLENENLRLKLEESQKLIETNNQVINFLNQKCNESYAPFKNFSNMLNYNTSNVATGLGNNLSGNIGNNLSGNTIKNSFPESNILTEKYQTNSNSFNEIQTKSNVLSNVNQNYKMNNMYNNSLNNNNNLPFNTTGTNIFTNTNNYNQENQQINTDNFIKPLTNFSGKFKSDTLGSNINTNFFENNKITNYNPVSIDNNNFSGTQNLTNLKYGGGVQETYTNTKGTSLTNQKYGNTIKLTQYLNNDMNNISGKEKESKFEDEEEQPRPYMSIGSGTKNNKNR